MYYIQNTNEDEKHNSQDEDYDSKEKKDGCEDGHSINYSRCNATEHHGTQKIKRYDEGPGSEH